MTATLTTNDAEANTEAVNYPIVTICGSMRFFNAMITVADELTRQGNHVLMPLVRKHSDQNQVHLNATPITAAELDAQHRAKIARAERIVIVTDWRGYIGDSTSNEITLTRSLGLPITYARVRTRNMAQEIIWTDTPEAPVR